MTAALIVLLAQDGELKFSDPVSAFVPNVPNGDNITIAELLKMRSGLFNYTAFKADYQQQWLTSLQHEDPHAPAGQKYGYGISYQRFGPNAAMYYHGGELPGFNSFMGYDPDNDVALVIWTNLTLSPDGKATAQAMLPTLLDEIYAGLSLVPPPTPTTSR
jgi:D-alanyl-D-alanine carboxypeptidase